METQTYVNARMLVIRPRDLKCEKKIQTWEIACMGLVGIFRKNKPPCQNEAFSANRQDDISTLMRRWLHTIPYKRGLGYDMYDPGLRYSVTNPLKSQI